jgi:myo-inositol 2-dehydrogenase/D-chiro-inositol 1-dehydrogenase
MAASSAKVILVGTGRMGSIRASAIFGNPKLTLASVVDANASAAAALANKYRVPSSYGSLLEALGDKQMMKGVKGIVVSSPTSSHPAVFEQAAKAGLHIFTEKPGTYLVSGILHRPNRLSDCQWV